MPPPAVTATVDSLAVASREEILSFLADCDVPDNSGSSDIGELLNHFIEDTNVVWIGSPKVHKVMQESGLRLCLKAPYLLYSILAFSASHLSVLNPDCERYRTAAIYHYEQSLASYLTELGSPLQTSRADSIVGCSHLQTMLAFGDAHHSFEGNAGVGDFTWLRAMRGVCILLDTPDLQAHFKNSVWYRGCNKTHGKDFTCDHDADDDTESIAGQTSKLLHQLCEWETSSRCPENPYQVALGRLCPLLREGITQMMIGPLMIMIGSVPSTFLGLLELHDPPALLILCYWSTLLSQIDQWWINRSAQVVCSRLCAYLDTVPDKRIHELLRIPAQTCGYTLRGFNDH